MLFHEFPEERWIHEIKMVGNLLDAHVGMFQFVLDLFYGMLVDDGKRGLPADLFDNGRQVLGGIAEQVCIIGYRTVCTVIFGYFFQEFAEDVHGSVVSEIGGIFLRGN